MRRVRFGSISLMRRQAFLGTLILEVLAILGGCSDEPFSFVRVSGKITYADGSLIPGERIVVQFIPIEAKTSGKRVAGGATGYLNPQDGTFSSLTTHKPQDGAVPGRYKVVVIAFQKHPQGEVLTKAVPPQYHRAESTPLEVEVSPSSRSFALTIEKPGPRGSDGT